MINISKMANLLEICVDRDSVDSDNGNTDHKITLKMLSDATYVDLCNKLKQTGYFPNKTGDYDVWVLTLGSMDCIFSYYAYSGKFNKGSATYSLKELISYQQGDNSFHLKRYATPFEWEKTIYDWYDGELYALWHDGWLEEIKYCEQLLEKMKLPDSVRKEFETLKKEMKEYRYPPGRI